MTIKICRLKTPGRSLKPICKLSADPGPCNANITRYRWDPQQGCTTLTMEDVEEMQTDLKQERNAKRHVHHHLRVSAILFLM